jgi:glutamate synthase (NADPH/NADH) small chain
MGKVTGFIEYQRSLPVLRAPFERVKNWEEFHFPLVEADSQAQGARCMNCGIPFCHAAETVNELTKGCPLHNLIPEWNDLVYRGHWQEAYKRLSVTNNFPEFTGRVCPAPCESACVLGINEEPVMIKEIELAIIDRAFEENWIFPNPPKTRTGRRAAIIGSGPAGLACADELNKLGHFVTVFERADRIGGLLTYGIPNMKLDKRIVERRVNLLAAEGIEFCPNINVGRHLRAAELKRDFDAVVVCTGAPQPRDLSIEGRNLKGIHFAMDFLTANTKNLLNSNSQNPGLIEVKDKNVIVIGGGDTGTDCIATSIRRGCRSVTQFEIMPRLSERILNHDEWLDRGRTFQVDYGQEEAAALFGGDPRRYEVLTKRFVDDRNGNLTGLETVRVEWIEEHGKRTLREISGTEKHWTADLVLLAMGFTGTEKNELLEDLGVEIDPRGNITVGANNQTNVPFVFAAGDCERGQSLVVWAIRDGRDAARGVHQFLQAGV